MKGKIMAVFYRFFLVSLCLVLLSGAHIACSREQEEAKAVQKNIGWNEVAEQLKDLEQKKKATLAAIGAKAPARTTPKPTPK